MKIPDLIRNAVLSRTLWLQKLLDPRRDLEKECGHPDTIDIQEYKRRYKRGDIAKRIINLYPEECFATSPQIYETEEDRETDFEKAWDALDRKHHILSAILRADCLSGIGRFGIILIGLDDGLELDQPVPGMNEKGEVEGAGAERRLLYLRTFDESFVVIKRLQNDVTNPRFGQPVLYEIEFAADLELNGSIAVPETSTSTTTKKLVHWSRIIHLVDNRGTDDLYGSPRLEIVYNRFLDLQKIAGGSGEMFWKGGFPGLTLEQPNIDPEHPITLDIEATKEQVEAYMNGLQRYIATLGLNVKSLSVQVADPTAHGEFQIRLISMAVGCPWRKLMGAEVGQLASGQDMVAWNQRLNRRREEYLSPYVIRPFIDRLITFRVLPPVPAVNEEESDFGYTVFWEDLNTPSKEEQAIVAEKQTNAIAKYVAGGCDQLIPPFQFLTVILRLTDHEAEAIIEDAEDAGNALFTDPEAEKAQKLKEIEVQAAARGPVGVPAKPGLKPAFGRNGH